MAPEAQLEWEARAGRPAGYAAFGSALSLSASQVYVTVAVDRPATRDDANAASESLTTLNDAASEFLVFAGLQAVSLVLLPVVLWYLYRAARHRRPQVPPVALVLAILGPLVAAGVVIARHVELISLADGFIASGPRTESRADDLLEASALPTIGGVGFGAQLALGLAVVLLSVHAMRAGLLSRFMGILGIVIGVLYALPIVGGPQIVQLFWLGALGLLFLGRWPGGRGPAWETGEAIPWPSAAQQRAELERRRGERGGASATAAEAASANAPGAAADDAREKRKKRKRRR